MKQFRHKRSSEEIDEHGFGFRVTLDRFELKFHPSAYTTGTPQKTSAESKLLQCFTEEKKKAE